jgi:hypothetical protein
MSNSAASAALRCHSVNGGARSSASPRRSTARRQAIAFPSIVVSPRFDFPPSERECGPRILGLARSIKSLVANA